MPTDTGHSGGIRVEGLAEMRRAFAVADKVLSRELVKGLRKAADPVASDAEILAGTRISHMKAPTEGQQDWRRMRVGVTRTSVYVAPRARRGAGRRRTNLFDLIAGRSLEPALDQNVAEVEGRIEDVLGTVGRAWQSA